MRRFLVTLHRWIGIVLAIYVVMLCLTGSVLVYRPELFRYFEPQPVFVETQGTLLSDEQLLAAAKGAFPEREPNQLWRGQEDNRAVEVELLDGDDREGWLFDPYTGEALQPSLNLGYRTTAFLLDLHTKLLGEDAGKTINGALGLTFVFLVLSGLLAWRPGKTRGWGLRRLHMTTGIWASAFVLMWAVTGVHLAWPWLLDGVNEYFDPFDEMNPVERFGDKLSYWLAYAHFGRFSYMPWCGPGACGEGLKALWAVVALVPAGLAVTGLWMWLSGQRSRARMRKAGRRD